MKADIFIPTSNRLASLRQCLDSLNEQSNKDFRIILVGLKEDEGVRGLIMKFSQIKIDYFIQKKKGLIGAANEALKIAENEIFVRIDDDVILDKDWYVNLIKTFELNKNIGGVTGPTIMSDEGLKSRDLTAFLEKFKHSKNIFLRLFYRFYNDYLYENKLYEVSQFIKSGVFTLGSNFETCLSIDKILEVGNLEACNWSARTKILRDIGGFDDIYLRGLGDYHEADAAFKVKKQGYRLVFNSKVKLRHNVEVGIVEEARPASYWRIQNFIIFYFRFFKIKSLDQLIKFLANIFLQNGYYFLKFLKTGRISQLGAVFGTIIGFSRAIFKYRN